MIRIEAELANGEKLLLTDFASCGKHWDNEDNCLMTVWMDVE